MTCSCGHEMQMLFAYDNAQNADPEHAYNLYVCPGCGLICKEDVWADAGRRWLQLDGALVTEVGPMATNGEDWRRFDEMVEDVNRIAVRQHMVNR